MISFPLVNQYFAFIQKKKLKNPVNVVNPPVLNLNKLDNFPSLFNTYFIEQLKLRDKLVLVNSLVKIFLFKTSPFTDKVIIGKNGWLYDAGHTINTYTNSEPLKPKQLDSIRTTLIKRNEWYKNNGIKFYVVLIPNKGEIYPEYLPETILKSSEMNQTDQILQFMKKDTDIVIIDLRKTLIEHKNKENLFFKTDNHWSFYGAYYGYCDIIRRIHKDFPAIGFPISLDSLKPEVIKHQAGGESVLLNMEEWLYDDRINLVPLYKQRSFDGKKKGYKCPAGFLYPWDYEIDKEVNDDKLPKAVFIRDSYIDYNITLFQEHFKRSVYIFDAWQYGKNYGIIENEKPDIVVLSIIDSGYDPFIDHMNDKDKNLK